MTGIIIVITLLAIVLILRFVNDIVGFKNVWKKLDKHKALKGKKALLGIVLIFEVLLVISMSILLRDKGWISSIVVVLVGVSTPVLLLITIIGKSIFGNMSNAKIRKQAFLGTTCLLAC